MLLIPQGPALCLGESGNRALKKPGDAMRKRRGTKSKYLVTMNIGGEVSTYYKVSYGPDRAEILARIDAAKQRGLIPSPWAVNPSDVRITEVPRSINIT